VTGPEIQDLRGKSPVAALKTLLERRMVRISGRKEVVGRPFLYATTREFLMHFGLRSLSELPPLEEFEETFGGEFAAPAASGPISEEHRAVGLVSTGEAEATLGSSEFEVHAHGVDEVVAREPELPFTANEELGVEAAEVALADGPEPGAGEEGES
jgi:hypothetical protein